MPTAGQEARATALVPPDPSSAHVLARLAIVGRRVDATVRACRARETGPDDPLRGLVVRGDEVDRLLDQRSSRPSTRAGGRDGGLDGEVAAAEAEADEAEAAGHRLRLRRLAAACGLDAVDVELLLVAMAPEVDARLERLYAFLHDDVTRRRATVALAFELCGLSPAAAPARARLLPGGPLVDAGLVEVADADRPFLGRSLRLPDRVTMHLLGDDHPDPFVARLDAWCPPSLGGDPDALSRAIARGARPCYLREAPAASGRALAAAAAERLGLGVVSLDLERLRDRDDLDALAAAAQREARLTGAVVVAGPVERLAATGSGAVAAFAELAWPTVLVGTGHWDPAWSRRSPLVVDVPAPTASALAGAWRALLGGDCAEGVDPAAATAASRLAPEQIDRAAATAWLRAAADGRPVEAKDLTQAVRSQNATGLQRLATRVEPTAAVGDLVLGEGTLERLAELCARARWRDQVLDGWGQREAARKGQGITALFAGPPGTGKTMAAEVVAGELGLDLYVVDLATVVDKYIGETEKNLDRIFAGAERVNGVLLFDEADALFGKRSGVSDAHDRYANVEVAYLLQRMERFDGIAVLTTNLRTNLDEAFLRRLDAVVDFPPPDASLRRQLWSKCLGPRLPLADDVDLDFCASAFELSGGHIRNAVLTAAFLAAADGRIVDMGDLVKAVAREYVKLGRLCLPSEFGVWHEWVAPPSGERAGA